MIKGFKSTFRNWACPLASATVIVRTYCEQLVGPRRRTNSTGNRVNSALLTHSGNQSDPTAANLNVISAGLEIYEKYMFIDTQHWHSPVVCYTAMVDY